MSLRTREHNESLMPARHVSRALYRTSFDLHNLRNLKKLPGSILEAEPLSASETIGFRGDLLRTRAASVILAEGPSIGFRIAAPNAPHNQALLLLKSGWGQIHQAGSTRTLMPGQGVRFTGAAPAIIAVSDFSLICLAADGALVPGEAIVGHATKPMAESPIPLASQVERLVATDRLDVSLFENAVAAVLASPIQEEAHAPVPEAADSPLERAARFVDEHLSSSTFHPRLLSEHLGLSRASLYRLFAAFGGVQAFIIRRRLDSSFRALTEGEGARASIKSIVFRHGFLSEAHFSRCFRARFNLSPSEVRSLKFDVRSLPPSVTEQDRVRLYIAKHRSA